MYTYVQKRYYNLFCSYLVLLADDSEFYVKFFFIYVLKRF